MFGKHDYDAVVVGGGPVGLFAGLCLVGQRLDVEILDGRLDLAPPHYPVTLGPAALRRLEDYGLLPALMRRGRVVRGVAFHHGGESLGHVDVEAAGGPVPHLLVVGYDALVGALDEALSARHARARRHHELMGLTLDPRGGARLDVAQMERVYTGYVVAAHEWEVKRRFEDRARFVVAADGADSLVRRRLELPFRADGPARTYEVFELGGLKDHGANIVVLLDGPSPGAFFPLPGGAGAWIFEREGTDEVPLDAARFRTHLGRRAPWFDEAAPLVRAQRVTLTTGLTDPPGRDGVWLAGDAAHPAGLVGARSLDAGLAEVHDLAERIAARLADATPAATFDEYAAGMRASWGRRAEAAPPLRAHADRIAAFLPGTGPELDAMLAQLGIRLA